MIKSVDHEPLFSLLSTDSNVVYTIPPYQREYSWTKNQWDELFDDLLQRETGDGHFLGTIICLNDTANATRQTELQLIDGQQRVTTLSLLLTAIYQELSECDDLSAEDEVDRSNLARMLTLRRPRRARLIPQLQNSNRDDYFHILSEAIEPVDGTPRKPPAYLGVRRLSKCLAHFRGRLQEHVASTADATPADTLFDFLEKVKNSVLVKLEVETHSDAFTLFESLNNRGLPLTPIDLIKNTLLAKADQDPGMSVQETYEKWSTWLEALGDSYAVQERFFRHFYNAFKVDPHIRLAGYTVATRPQLIAIYEKLMAQDLPHLIDRLTAAVKIYERIMNVERRENTPFDRQLRNLSEAQGAAAYMLLLFLMDKFGDELTEDDLAGITTLLINFFVRRNLTSVPPTHAIDRRFAGIVEELNAAEAHQAEEIVRRSLREFTADDEQFYRALQGPVYDDNVAVTRYILTALAEDGMTIETRKDLWERVPADRSGNMRYVWTIEHILPQGENIPTSWVEMLGGPEAAKAVHEQHVHRLGNLTITGFNAALGNSSFEAKRDRTDAHGRYVGYKNGLSLNEDLAHAERWSEKQIEERTKNLAARAVKRFAL